MFDLESIDSFKIKGKGTAYCVLNPIECNNFDHLIDHEVKINGTVYKVTGVERFAHHPPWRAGEKIGLLVKY